MASNYTGVATATQAPSGPPIPGGDPIASIPADGDPRNAASIAQMVKVAMDWVSWLTKPRARTGIWAEAVMRFRSALLHTRFGIDHLGLPGGRIQQWNEMWERGNGWSGTLGPAAITGTPVAYDPDYIYRVGLVASGLSACATAANLAAVQALLGTCGVNLATSLSTNYNPVPEIGSHWRARTVQTTGVSSLIFYIPSASFSQRHRVVLLRAGDAAQDYVNIWRAANVNYDDDLTFALEWEAQLQAADLATLSGTMGFCTEGGLAAGGTLASDFAVFRLPPGGGNWRLVNRSAGATTDTDSGIAATTGWTRFRVEFHGLNGEGGVRQLMYYINGALVGGGPITANVPVATASAAASFALVNTAGGASSLVTPLRIGPARFVSNLYGSDVF